MQKVVRNSQQAGKLQKEEWQGGFPFVKSRNFVQICSCHTYTEILLQPWGYKPGLTANSAEYDLIGMRMTAANPMQRGGISTILYTAAGNSVDHHRVRASAASARA